MHSKGLDSMSYSLMRRRLKNSRSRYTPPPLNRTVFIIREFQNEHQVEDVRIILESNRGRIEKRGRESVSTQCKGLLPPQSITLKGHSKS